MTLYDDAVTFLQSDGWSIATASHREVIRARRAGIGDNSEHMTVWCPQSEESDELRRREAGLLHRFAEDARTPGQKYLLVESTQGMSTDLRRLAFQEHNITVQVPVQFFDARFKWDEEPVTNHAATAGQNLRKEGDADARRRTPQPFRTVGTDVDGRDLLSELARRFDRVGDWTRPIVLVTAPAGFGKSMLFSSLFATLYANFQKAKNQHRRAHRPLPLLPEYIPLAGATAVRPMVEAMLQAEVARSIKLPTFEWMLTRGYASWLLDGLDEVIAQDPSFFQYIHEIVAHPDNPTTPRILICVRDSLLSSSQPLRDFLAVAHEYVDEYRLLPWQAESITTFARMKLQKNDHRMLTVLEQKPDLMKLCGTPYYADLLAVRFAGHQLVDIPDDYTEMNLIHDATNEIIDREYKKGLLQEATVSRYDLLDVIGYVAMLELENGNRGVSIDELQELAELVLPSDLSEPDRQLASAKFCQLPFFRGATEQRRVRFAQDVIFEHQVGLRAADYFGVNPLRFLQLLDCRPFPPDSLVLRVLRNRVEELGACEELLTRLSSTTGDTIAFRNILQVLLRLRSRERLLKHAPMERQDLSGLIFSGVALNGVSLRGANLESTRFVGCDLTECDLSEATLHGTRFDGCRPSLANAVFGDLTGFVSVEIDSGRAIEDVTDFVRLLRLDGSTARAFVGPCPTALQLRFLFLKFVRPDGHYRRDELDEKGLLSGRRFVDPGSVVNGAVRAGFLKPVPGRHRYERTRSQLYADMVGFAQNLRVTPTIRSLLEETCRVDGCSHIVIQEQVATAEAE
jgi:hypothetical protein